METVSHVRGSPPRVSAADLKHSAAVRAESVRQQQVDDAKQKVEDKAKMVEHMADQFFLSHIRRPDEDSASSVSALSSSEDSMADTAPDDMDSSNNMLVQSDQSGQTAEAPRGYKPRGSYVDVRA